MLNSSTCWILPEPTELALSAAIPGVVDTSVTRAATIANLIPDFSPSYKNLSEETISARITHALHFCEISVAIYEFVDLFERLRWAHHFCLIFIPH
jgi:hypothetical protein